MVVKLKRRQAGAGNNSSTGAQKASTAGKTKDTRMSKYKGSQPLLSAINERDEYTTIHDVLNSRSSYLKQEELWAICRECCLTIKRIGDSADSVQSLSIMLETLAFDAVGHVHFTDHDSEVASHYIPPEYEKIGNSCKGHVYSLGMLIYEASAYNCDSSKIPEHSIRLRKLLYSMVNNDYGERVSLDSVISECDQYFLSAGVGSSHDICKHLISSVIENVETNSTNGDTSYQGIEMNVDGDSPVNDSKHSTPPPSNPSLRSMSVEDLVEKYTPSRLKEESQSAGGSSSSVLSPPSDFDAKSDKPTMKSVDKEIRKSNSAFLSQQHRKSDTENEMEDGEVGEGATLRAGQVPLKLPEAYHSSATHFSPIVIASHDTNTPAQPSNPPSTASKADRTIKELKKQLLKSHNVQDSSPKISPRQSLSLSENNSKQSKLETQAIPPRLVSDVKSRKPSAAPVTQAVRPLLRQSVTKASEDTSVASALSSAHNLYNSGISVDAPMSILPSAVSSQSTSGLDPPLRSVDLTQASPTAASISHAHTVVVNNSAMTSSPLISSYSTVPVMIPRDAAAAGAVGWLPVMTNMPYWTPLPPQQAAAAVSSVPTISTPPNIQRDAAVVPVSATNRAAVSHTADVPNTHDASFSSTTLHSANTTQPQELTDHAPTSSVESNSLSTSCNTVTGAGSAGAPVPQTSLTSSTKATIIEQTITRQPKSPESKTEEANNKRKEKKQHTSSKGSKSKDPSRKKDPQQLLMLTKIRQLLKNEFAFDGYMNHGQEDLDMAEFIGSLKLPALDFTNWCNIIVAKYGDLYWSEELLVSLYEVIHGQKPDIDRPPSGALRAKSARVLSVDEPGGPTATQSVTQSVSQRFSTSPFRPIPLSESGLVVSSTSHTTTTSKKSKRSIVKPKAMLPQILSGEGGSSDVSSPHKTSSLSRLKSVSVSEFTPDSISEDLTRQHSLPSAGLTKSRSQTMLQSTAVAPESKDLTPLVKSLILPNGSTRQVMYIEGKQANQMFDDIWKASPGSATSAFDHDSDSHSHSSASELRVKGRLLTYSLSNSVIGDEMVDSAIGSKLSSEYDSENGQLTHLQNSSSSASVAICSTYVYASYMVDNRDAVSVLADKTARSVFVSGYENKSVDGIKKKIADLSQQIGVNVKRRNKACKYVKKIHESSQGKGSGDYKAMLNQIQVDYKDAVTELDYLCHAKLQLEILLAGQASIDVSCLFSFTKPSRPLLVIETKENPRLQFQTKIDSRSSKEVEVLYAGEPYGLLSYLYAKGSLEDGYILDFFHSYRYFLSAKDIMAFITEKYNAAKELKPCPIREKVMKRSLDLLTFWVTSYYSADFILSPTVVVALVNFLQDEVLSEHQTECEPLLRLLDEYENDKGKNSVFINPLPVNDSLPHQDEELNQLSKKYPFTRLVTGDKLITGVYTEDLVGYCCSGSIRRSNTFRRSDSDDWAVDSKWNATKTILTIGSGKSTVQYQKTGYSIISYVPKSKKLGKESITPSSSFSSDSFSIIDHRAGDIAEQLTLMDQTLFQNIHPVNFMNTLAQGIGASLVGSNADTIPNQEKKLLFHSDYVQLVGVSDMIQHSRRLAHWVTAEVISAANVKTQVAVVSKFLHIAKICKDLRNFATSMAIKDGLDHPLIRYIPAWKEVPTKLMQELKDTKLLLKTNADAVKAPEDMEGIPTIPCALIFSLHVQQLEQGGFTLANGMYRWPKLRSLAKLVDLIRICKNSTFKFVSDPLLKEQLQNRISDMHTHNLETLVWTSSDDNKSGTSSSSRWSTVLKKMKGKFA